MNRIIYVMTLFLFLSCASRPVLYPNSKYQVMGKERANEEIDKCIKEGDDFLESPRAKKVLASSGRGAAVGGTVGVVSGLISGDWLKGLLSGAAIGGAAGATAGAISPDRLKQAYVNRCLSNKGLDVIGWD